MCFALPIVFNIPYLNIYKVFDLSTLEAFYKRQVIDDYVDVLNVEEQKRFSQIRSPKFLT